MDGRACNLVAMPGAAAVQLHASVTTTIVMRRMHKHVCICCFVACWVVGTPAVGVRACSLVESEEQRRYSCIQALRQTTGMRQMHKCVRECCFPCMMGYGDADC